MTPPKQSVSDHALSVGSAPWFPSPDAGVARDLLAREMWMRENDSDGSEWDNDELLTDTYEEYEARATEAIFAACAPVPEAEVTHGRHCPCSACAAEDWTRPDLAPCGMHGYKCPRVYAPLRASRSHPHTTLQDPAKSDRR